MRARDAARMRRAGAAGIDEPLHDPLGHGLLVAPISAWLIWRRTTKPEPHVQLLMELENATEREKDATPRTDDTEPNSPWAKSGDWWKKADD